jgi:hypothetical protein
VRKIQSGRSQEKIKPDDVETGREYVEAYVLFVLYIARIYATAKGVAKGH